MYIEHLNIVSSIFVILAAFFNACMDILENENFFRSKFSTKNQKFWYKRESWKYATEIFGYKIDAWHLSKSIMIVLLTLAIVYYKPIFNYKILDILTLGILWNSSFNLSYYNILK